MKYLILLILLTFNLLVNGQDTIVKRDAKKIICKVVEVNIQDIKYKRMDNIAGPTYLLEKTSVASINYYNGNKDIFDIEAVSPPVTVTSSSTTNQSIEIYQKYFIYKNKRLSESQMHDIVLKLRSPDLNLMVRKIKNKKLFQELSFGASIPLIIYGFYEYNKDAPSYKNRGNPPSASMQLQSQKTGLTIIAAALACDAISICFLISRKKHNKLLVSAYNQVIISK